MGHLQLVVANGAYAANGPYANGYGYWWWGGWWWVWAVIAFLFLVIVFAAAGNYTGYYDYRRPWRRRITTPLRGPASGEPLREAPVDDYGAGWGFAWVWLLIIFIICIAFFGGGHWWWGGY
jgi:hypothetical protein